jgi:hypothetical protein
LVTEVPKCCITPLSVPTVAACALLSFLVCGCWPKRPGCDVEIWSSTLSLSFKQRYVQAFRDVRLRAPTDRDLVQQPQTKGRTRGLQSYPCSVCCVCSVCVVESPPWIHLSVHEVRTATSGDQGQPEATRRWECACTRSESHPVTFRTRTATCDAAPSHTRHHRRNEAANTLVSATPSRHALLLGCAAQLNVCLCSVLVCPCGAAVCWESIPA